MRGQEIEPGIYQGGVGLGGRLHHPERRVVALVDVLGHLQMLVEQRLDVLAV